MEVVISLDAEDSVLLAELGNTLYISAIVFTVSVDQHLEQKIKKLVSYLPLLAERPSIKSRLKITSIEKVTTETYPVVALGGTFDYLHIGHQLLLLYGVLTAQNTMYIGVTGPKLLSNKKHKQALQTLTVRMKEIQIFVKSIKPDLKYIIFQLNDPFGPTVTQEYIDCLVASPETASSVHKINQIRQSANLKALQLVTCPLFSSGQEVHSKVSSTTIRQFYLQKNDFSEENLKQYKGYYSSLINAIEELKGQQIQDRGIVDMWFSDIFEKYSEYWRFYHTNQHIYQLFTWWYSPRHQQTRQLLSLKDRVIVQIALFFHDIVYRPSSVTNEKESATIAAQFVKACFEGNKEQEQIAQKVTQLIVQTQNHVPTSKLSQIVYDLDMGILNSDKNKYEDYASKVKKQFFPLVKEQYNQKRKQFLVKTLNQKMHFSFPTQNLKSNLEWEISNLENNDL